MSAGAQNVRFRTVRQAQELQGQRETAGATAGSIGTILCRERMMLCCHPPGLRVRARSGGKSRAMQDCGESERLLQTGSGTVRAAGAPSPNPGPAPELIYDLRRNGGGSDGFYAETARFSAALVAGIESRAGSLLDGYSRHVREFLGETPRSRGEYAIELLTLGMALREYEGAAHRTPGWVVELARALYAVRCRSAHLKPAADLARTALARLFLAPEIGRKARTAGSPLVRLTRLIDWLQATGEFEHEALRLLNWRSYLAALKPEKADHWMDVAGTLFDNFERQAGERLGAYTQGVDGFLKTEYTRRRWREDLLLCGRSRVEYHLNMVAAEVMNRGLRADFDRTQRKVVLVPTCMRGRRAESCGAQMDGVDMTCTGCDPDCAVNRITQRISGQGARVYLVPHASGFSQWLERWQREPEVGVTAVACILNILPGGYEMRARGIASQCVPLDYPGCRKHWNRAGISTGVNEERLVQIVARPAA